MGAEFEKAGQSARETIDEFADRVRQLTVVLVGGYAGRCAVLAIPERCVGRSAP
jgi:hypothetical protein